ncbi:MAG: SWIM zinc finger family protein [Oscillospiraceae bacterium]|nr:SWIM zinc finger family protein [Oscillospiraceae bacterium]
MGLLDCASGASLWRGYDYYKEKKVLSVEKTDEDVFMATVAGSAKKPYSVELRINHPRKSKCSCPHANGKRIICKHIVAVYFTVLPKEAEKFYTEVIAAQEEEEQREEELADRVYQYVWHMKKDELQQALLELLFDGPEWQYDRFLREKGLDEY